MKDTYVGNPLGFETTGDPLDALADALVSADEGLLSGLVAYRERHGISIATVAERMGISEGDVRRLEVPMADMSLATLRRYSMALGVVVHHRVVPMLQRGTSADRVPLTVAEDTALARALMLALDCALVSEEGECLCCPDCGSEPRNRHPTRWYCATHPDNDDTTEFVCGHAYQVANDGLLDVSAGPNVDDVITDETGALTALACGSAVTDQASVWVKHGDDLWRRTGDHRDLTTADVIRNLVHPLRVVRKGCRG